MTQRERFLAAARDERPDVVPAAPYGGNFGAAIADVPIGEFNTDSARMADAQIAAWELLHHDVVCAQSDNYYIAEGFGCEINQPANVTPHLTRPAIDSLDRIGELTVPDPTTDGRMPVYLDAVRRLRRHFGDDVAVRGPGTGPFSLASYLCGGTVSFLMEIATAEADDDRELSRLLMDLMEIASDALIAFLKALVDAGSDVAQAGDSLASLSMISPAIYEKYVYPFERKVFDAMNPYAHDRGAVTLLHICGDTRRILPLMAQTGADILEIDSAVDLAEARSLTGSRVALMGNLDPTAILFSGTPETVRVESERCISATDGRDGGFILGSGCEVVMGTPVDNLRAMVAAAHDTQ
ncbi:MAG: hypothetical protein EA382_12120 [Spirochaetaceae bacterium]|nr:MAG: hypothetical protein EA382_12120 [Spirochaetaceae bacterium]